MVFYQKMVSGWNPSVLQPCFGDAPLFLENTRTLPGSLKTLSSEFLGTDLEAGWTVPQGVEGKVEFKKFHITFYRIWLFEYVYPECCQVLELLCLHKLLSATQNDGIIWSQFVFSSNLILQEKVRTHCSFFYKHITVILFWICFSLRAR